MVLFESEAGLLHKNAAYVAPPVATFLGHSYFGVDGWKCVLSRVTSTHSANREGVAIFSRVAQAS